MCDWALYKKGGIMLESLFFGIRSFFAKIKRRIWCKHILVWWCRLWIRKDEFHWTLSTDGDAMMEMNPQELKKYHEDLVRRREIAHNRDMERRSK